MWFVATNCTINLIYPTHYSFTSRTAYKYMVKLLVNGAIYVLFILIIQHSILNLRKNEEGGGTLPPILQYLMSIKVYFRFHVNKRPVPAPLFPCPLVQGSYNVVFVDLTHDYPAFCLDGYRSNYKQHAILGMCTVRMHYFCHASFTLVSTCVSAPAW